jgi:hypothetical protein
VIDSAEQCAQDVATRLLAAGLSAPAGSTGTLKCFVSDDPVRFRSLAGRFLGTEIDLPARVSPEELIADSVPVTARTLRVAG